MEELQVLKLTLPEGSGCKGAVIHRVKVERGGNAGTADVSRNSVGDWDDINHSIFHTILQQTR